MHFAIEQHFEASVADVEDVLTSPEFLAQLAELPNLGRPVLLDQRIDGTVVHQRTRYAFVGQLSGAVRAVVDSNRLTWVEEADIDRQQHHTVFRIVPDHYEHLLRCSGTFQLESHPGGCTRRAEGDILVAVPLVGAKVEAAIVSGLREHAALEVAAVAAWLARSGPDDVPAS